MRYTLPLFVCMLVVAVSWNWKSISSRAREMYWFSKCMNHATPEGTVLLEADPEKVNALMNGNPDYIDASKYNSPMLTIQMEPKTSPGGMYVPRSLRELERLSNLSRFPFSATPTAYLGAIQTPSGTKRLLIVRGREVKYTPNWQYLSTTLIQPPTVLQATRSLMPTKPGKFSATHPMTIAILSAGILDPKNPSHVSIPFNFVPRVDEEKSRAPIGSGIVDVYLHDDDTLSITERTK